MDHELHFLANHFLHSAVTKPEADTLTRTLLEGATIDVLALLVYLASLQR